MPSWSSLYLKTLLNSSPDIIPEVSSLANIRSLMNTITLNTEPTTHLTPLTNGKFHNVPIMPPPFSSSPFFCSSSSFPYRSFMLLTICILFYLAASTLAWCNAVRNRGSFAIKLPCPCPPISYSTIFINNKASKNIPCWNCMGALIPSLSSLTLNISWS